MRPGVAGRNDVVRRFLCFAFVVLAMVWLPLPAWGLINPNFTPIHVTNDADTILVVKIKNKEIAQKVDLAVSETLKGKAPSGLAIDLDKADKQAGDEVRKQFTQFAGEEGLLFVGKDEKGNACGFLHFHGKWMRLSPPDGETFPLVGIDSNLDTTWSGGTDMLTRCVRYILADNNATVPVQARASWQGAAKVGNFAGPARDIAAIDLAGEGTYTLFVAGEKGDRLFKPGADVFEDITAKLKLQSSSRLATWGNFNGEGRLDLASYDGTNLTIWSQAADGTFSSAQAGGAFTLPANCVGMAVIAIGSRKTPGLLLSPASGPPILLKPTGKSTFEATPLPAPAPDAVKDLGAAGACIVADFTGDAMVDVIQPFEKGGLIYLGNKSGGFDAPKACNVCCGQGGGRAAIADLDGDGLPDIVMAGAEGVFIFQNKGHGDFEEDVHYCGEVSYKSQAQAVCCAVGDFNNDTRQGLVIGYRQQQPQVYFNRGFRSFGEEPDLELTKGAARIPDVATGQQLILMADLDNSGAMDLIVVLNNGDLWRVSNDIAGNGPTSVGARITPKSSLVGPVNVSLWQDKHCMGSAVAQAGMAPAFFGVENANSYTLKWTGAGGKEMTKEVVVDKAVHVVLGDGK